ncbi:extensin [Streptomyces sp. MNU89]|uniref:extensin n=1 Tax=Streptomyces sp. MNU89 TaxID=2560025 RepID=UPI001E546822|nr:extensin [Streptomyces sp. MNU89]MCC9738486.1 extensin [Streptomyces sp. MNU89]
MKQLATREAIGLLRSMTWVLSAVAILALVFTTVNVTRFATSRGVPLPIAILLDPMIGTALAGVLYVDARLASWGIRPPAWSTALRWGAGCTAALMNSWESLWPDGQIGWPRQADPAAVLLHLTPALLLIALTETIAAYRRTVTDLLSRIGSPDPAAPSAHLTLSQRRPIDPCPHRSGHHRPRSGGYGSQRGQIRLLRAPSRPPGRQRHKDPPAPHGRPRRRQSVPNIRGPARR